MKCRHFYGWNNYLIFLGPIYVSQTDMDHTVLVHYCTKCTPFIQLDKYTLPHIFAVCTRSISHAEYKLRKLQSALCESFSPPAFSLLVLPPPSFYFLSASLTFSFPCDPDFSVFFLFFSIPYFLFVAVRSRWSLYFLKHVTLSSHRAFLYILGA